MTLSLLMLLIGLPSLASGFRIEKCKVHASSPNDTVLTMPTYRVSNKAFTNHRLLLGTHTSGQASDFLQIASLQLPKRDGLPGEENIGKDQYDEEKGGRVLLWNQDHPPHSDTDCRTCCASWTANTPILYHTTYKSRWRGQQSPIHASKSGPHRHENDYRRCLDL
jgi:hypothetical protein